MMSGNRVDKDVNESGGRMLTIRRWAGSRVWLVAATALVLALGVSACYEDYNLDYSDYDTALTLYDNTANFAAYRYFIMPDTIVHLYDTTGNDPLKDFRKYDTQIKELVKSNFLARGYQYLGEDSSSIPVGIDRNQVLAVFIGQFASEYVGYYYTYWWGYWGYWWGYYPPYYPPGYGGTYEVTTGSTLILAIDYGRSAAEARIRSLWEGKVTGLAGDAAASVQQRLSTNINQLFLQSPYLYAGQ
jgi:hypothetical protein